jgi:hypothetical protein
VDGSRVASLTPELQKKLIDGVHAEVGSRSVDESAAERDEVLLGLIELRSKPVKTVMAPNERSVSAGEGLKFCFFVCALSTAEASQRRRRKTTIKHEKENIMNQSHPNTTSTFPASRVSQTLPGHGFPTVEALVGSYDLATRRRMIQKFFLVVRKKNSETGSGAHRRAPIPAISAALSSACFLPMTLSLPKTLRLAGDRAPRPRA